MTTICIEAFVEKRLNRKRWRFSCFQKLLLNACHKEAPLMRIVLALGILSCRGISRHLGHARRRHDFGVGWQGQRSWPALVTSSDMKRKSRSGTDETQKPAAPQKTGPNPPGIDYRSHPERYKIARGEQGVLTVEPYKSEILPHWRFR